MPAAAKPVCDVHLVVLKEVEDGAKWREQHEADDKDFRDWIRNEFTLIRQCIDSKMEAQTDKRRQDVGHLHSKIDRLQLLIIGQAIGTAAGLLYLIITHALAH
jgi:hypothetical protein